MSGSTPQGACKGRASHLLAVACLAVAPSAGAAPVVVENADPAGVGLNDPTPAAPVGGNGATTRGAQALAAITYAAQRWAGELESDVPIRISASLAPLACNAGGGILGSAAPRTFVRDAPGLRPGVWYPIALANHLTGVDLVPGEPDIDARFNGLAGSPGCLEGSPLYMGLDAAPRSGVDLVTVALHELAHGLGVTTLVDLETGALHQGAPDVFSLFVLDERSGRTWPELDDAARTASARQFQELTWSGPAVTLLAGEILARGVATLTLGAPVDRSPPIGLSAFGPRLSESAVSGAVSRMDDGVGDPFDGCGPAAAPLTGRVALIEAGGCDDVTKVLTAQAAGAIAALVVDDRLVLPPLPLSGPNDGRVTIPAVRIGQDDAGALRTSLASDVLATLGIDASRGVGTSPAGRVYLETSDPPVAGRSVTHWDPSATPDLLMEESPRPGHGLDLTLALLTDLGWTAATRDGGATDGGPSDASAADSGDAALDATGTEAGDAAPWLDASTGGAAAGGAGSGGRPGTGGTSSGGDGARSDAGPDATPGPGARRSGGDGCGCVVGQRAGGSASTWLEAWVGLLALLRSRSRRRSAAPREALRR